MFEQVSIFGLGLIGGSIALDLKRTELAKKVVGYDIRLAHRKMALQLGIVDDIFDAGNPELSHSEIVILALPVATLPQVLTEIASFIAPSTIVTDTGSVKKPILHFIQSQNFDFEFIGGHPIAGSEKFGPTNAKTHLFENKKVILTPEKKTSSVEKISQMWSKIGGVVVQMDAERHDQIFAEVSHLPHLLAYATIEAIGNADTPQVLKYSGAGLKDYSRIASSSPEMWADIFLENKEFLLQSLERFNQTIQSLQHSITTDDKEAIIDHLLTAKKLKDQWIP